MSRPGGPGRIAALAMPLLLGVAAFAHAGLNAGAEARLYWQSTSNGTGLAARDNTSSAPNLLVTVKGLKSLRGVEVQLFINSFDGAGVPAAWHMESGGCADGFATFNPGGRGGLYPNVFNDSVAVPGLHVVENTMLLGTGDCRTHHGIGQFHLAAVGEAGSARNPSREYAIWSINFDLANSTDSLGVPCAGGQRRSCGPPGCVFWPRHQSVLWRGAGFLRD